MIGGWVSSGGFFPDPEHRGSDVLSPRVLNGLKRIFGGSRGVDSRPRTGGGAMAGLALRLGRAHLGLGREATKDQAEGVDGPYH